MRCRHTNVRAKFILLSQLDAISYIPGFHFSREDKISIIPVCCRSPRVTDTKTFELYFGDCGKGDMYKRILISNGAIEGNISIINYYTQFSESDISILLSNQYIVLPGGLMELGIKRMLSTHLDKILAKFEGTFICFSAGALMLYDNYLITPNKIYKKLKIDKGLGWLSANNYYIDVHFEEDNCRQINDILYVSRRFKKQIFAITQTGHIIIENGQIIQIQDVWDSTNLRIVSVV